MIIPCADGGGEFAIAGEAGVQRAIAVVSHQCEVLIAAIPAVPCHQNLAVGLHSDTLPGSIIGPDSGGEYAVAGEGGVQRAVAVVTHHGEVVVAVGAGPRHQDLAVGLHSDAVSFVMAQSNSRGEHAVAGEAGVQRAVAVVTHQCDVFVAAVPAGSRHQDLAVGLHGDAVSSVMARTNVRREHAVARETGVQRSVGVVTHQGEIIIAAVEASPCHQDLAVGLHGHAACSVIARTNGSSKLAVARETGIQRAVGVVTRQCEVIIAAVIAGSCHHNLAVGL